MKKFLKKCCITVLIGILILTIIPLQVFAVTNPYPSSQTISGVTTIPCTYYAWQQAYDNTGVAMPNFGNAKNWYTSAKNAGYSVGTVAKPKSIAVWEGGTYGHVSYVVSVNGSKMTVNEGGMYNSSGGAYNGTGILNGNTVNSVVGQQKGNGSTKILIGFIYLTESVSGTVTINAPTADKTNTITDKNAVLWAKVNKPSSSSVTKIGIRVRPDGGSYTSSWSLYQAPSQSYSGQTYMYPYYNLNEELGITLTHVTKYYYQFYAVVGGKEYWSSEQSFTTGGSHSYGSWSTTKAATCTATGTKTRKCTGCSKTETQTIAALGHNYSSSYTVDKAATCTAAGSKSKHCTRCSATTSVTSIAATGHSYGAWSTTKAATCTSTGTKVRKCSSCSATENHTVAALGHDYSSSWATDKVATCTAAGSKSHHCSRCNAKTDITTVTSLGHSWSEWSVTAEPTTTASGRKTRKCTRSGCTATETATVAKLAADGHTHNFGEWETATQATCTANGSMLRKCISCDQTENMTVTAIGHLFSDWVIVTEATTENDGLTERTCSACGTKETSVIPKIVSDNKVSADADNNGEIIVTEPKNHIKDYWLFITIGAAIIAAAAVITVILLIKKKKQ